MGYIYRAHGYKTTNQRRDQRRGEVAALLEHAKVATIILLFVVLIGTAYYFTHRSAPKIVSVTQSSTMTADKSFGIAEGDTLPGLTNAQLQTTLNGIAKLGIRWIRLDISWADVQPKSPTRYNWSALDRVIKSAHQRGFKILGTIAYTPPWAAVASCADKQDQKCAPASDAQFAAFAADAAKRYGADGVDAWEVWNEPNVEGFWQPAPNPKAYTNLLRATYDAIKLVDPGSTIISGSLGPLDGNGSSISQLSFLTQMYADGAKPYFNALGFHPYSYPALPLYEAQWSSWTIMDDLPVSVRSIMTTHGDKTKPIWVTEFGSPTNGPGAIATLLDFNFDAHPDHVSEAMQAEMITQAAAIYKSSPWMGSFFYYTYQDSGTSPASSENFFGLLTYNGIKKPAYYALHNAITDQ